ncbi:MAG: hypothetical protein OJF50_001194 [Nitrospira sp.]|nr:hypothetical protein [Nitrospira sp.]
MEDQRSGSFKSEPQLTDIPILSDYGAESQRRTRLMDLGWLRIMT